MSKQEQIAHKSLWTFLSLIIIIPVWFVIYTSENDFSLYVQRKNNMLCFQNLGPKIHLAIAIGLVSDEGFEVTTCRAKCSTF